MQTENTATAGARTQERISMAEFFNLPVVKACQDAQKQNKYGSGVHKLAFYAIKEQAEKYGVSAYFGEYEEGA